MIYCTEETLTFNQPQMLLGKKSPRIVLSSHVLEAVLFKFLIVLNTTYMMMQRCVNQSRVGLKRITINLLLRHGGYILVKICLLETSDHRHLRYHLNHRLQSVNMSTHLILVYLKFP
jgi:hypothetical protein